MIHSNQKFAAPTLVNKPKLAKRVVKTVSCGANSVETATSTKTNKNYDFVGIAG